MSILTAALSVGLIHFFFQNENELVETFIDIIKVLLLLLITFIGITILPYLTPAYILSKKYKSTSHFMSVGLYGLFFFPVALIFSFAPGIFIYIFFVCAKIDLEVLLFAFTGGIMMSIMRGFLHIQYTFPTSSSKRRNIFWVGMISGTLFYWVVVMMPESNFYGYPIAPFIGYSIFLIGFNTTLIFSESNINFKVINIILILCFIAFLLDVFVNQRFEPVLYIDVPESEHFW